MLADTIQNLRRFPQDSSVEIINGGLCVITVETYNGEYVFDVDTLSENLPDFSIPDHKNIDEDLPDYISAFDVELSQDYDDFNSNFR